MAYRISLSDTRFAISDKRYAICALCGYNILSINLQIYEQLHKEIKQQHYAKI